MPVVTSPSGDNGTLSKESYIQYSQFLTKLRFPCIGGSYIACFPQLIAFSKFVPSSSPYSFPSPSISLSVLRVKELPILFPSLVLANSAIPKGHLHCSGITQYPSLPLLPIQAEVSVGWEVFFFCLCRGAGDSWEVLFYLREVC